MFENILVPLDGSRMADRILPHVVAIAQIPDPPLSQGAQQVITLLRVLEVGGGGVTAVDPLAWHFAEAEAQAQLDEAAKQLKLLGLASNTVLLEGGAARRIVEYVHKQGVDLLVLSSHGQGGLSDWNISGITQKVIHRAGASFMLIRSSDSSHAEQKNDRDEVIQYKRILAPLDGSQRAENALHLACALAERHAAELLVVHVAARPEMIQRVPLSPEDKSLAESVVSHNTIEADKYFAQLQHRLPPNTQTRVLIDDSISRALHDLVEQEQVDLVVLSAHGHACNSQWPYSALVNSFITYGATSLLVLQDLPPSQRRASVEHRAEDATMPTRSAHEDEGLNVRANFEI